MIEIEIDGKTLTAKEGEMIIQVADAAGIYIPRYCYHKKLSIAASCRMCLVEVDKSRKPLPACATPVMPGMKVFTQSKMALDAQRAVMEFLLINHPLDCPICDQGGVCELQDLAIGFGGDESRYDQAKRAVADKYIGPFIDTHMTRCIQCTRCVRFGEEVAGQRELGATHRGGDLKIQTFLEEGVKSELSGNMIDICPVGALTSRPFRFQARGWEMRQHPTIAIHDCVGSNIFVHTRAKETSSQDALMRVVPRENEALNETWISDRDRFSYEAIASEARLTEPMLKTNGVWQKVDWQTALTKVHELLSKVLLEAGSHQIGALTSANSTLEEFYLFQKFMRALGSNNIDYRVRQHDFSDQVDASAYPQLNMPLADIENLNAVLLVGSYVRHEQPLLNHRLRKAIRKHKANIMCVNPIDYAFNYPLSAKAIVAVNQMPVTLAQIIKAISLELNQPIPEAVKLVIGDLYPAEITTTIAKQLIAGERRAIFLGPLALNHPQAATINMLAQLLGQMSGAAVGYLTEGANAAGAWLAGAIPHRKPAGINAAEVGLTAKEMLTRSLKAYLLLNVEPEYDSAYASAAIANLKDAEAVIAFSAFITPQMQEYADVLLPIATFGEYAGTYVNVEGLWQLAKAATLPAGVARPAWKVLRVLGNLFKLPDFDYAELDQVTQEIHALVGEMTPTQVPVKYSASFVANTNVIRIADWPMYRTDAIVRQAPALQEALEPEVATIRVNPALADRLQLANGEMVLAVQGQSSIKLPLLIDEGIADQQVYIPAGLVQTVGFGETFGSIELSKL